MAGGFPLVGRDPELAWLHSRIAAAAAGNGGLVLVEGEAGIGKSALVARVMLEAGVPCVAVGRCPGPGETPPFGPWMEIIAALAAAPAAGEAAGEQPLGPDIADTRLGLRQQAMALLAWLGQRAGVCLVLLEDLHWADPASLELLRQITAELGRTRVVVLATVRIDEVTRRHPLWTLLPNLQRSGAERLPLGRLRRDSVEPMLRAAVAELGQGAAHRVADLYERTGGHPLFLFELLAAARRPGPVAGGQALPDSVLQAIDLKLQRLSEPARGLLGAAAVIGERFEYDLLAAVAAQPDATLAEALEEALALRLIRSDGPQHDRLAFDHALVREAILSRLITPRRRVLHAAIADVLLQRPVPDVDRVALHLSLAGDSRGAVWLLAAGDRALRLGAVAQAKEHYARALQLLAAGDECHGELLLKYGYTLAYHAPEQACVQWEAAVQAASAAGDPAVGIWARHLLLREQFRLGEPGVLAEMARLEREQAARLKDKRYRQLETGLFGQPCGYPRMAGERARALAVLGRQSEVDAILAEVQAMAEPGAPMADVTYAAFPAVLHAGDFDRGHEILRQVRQQRLQLRQYRLAASMQFNRLFGLLYYRSERVEEIDEAARQLLADEHLALERAGEGTTHGDFSPLGVYQFLRGDWQAARHNLLEYYRQNPEEDRPLRRLSAAELARAGGAPEQALALLAPIKPHTPGEEPRSNQVNLSILLTRVEAHLDLGDLGSAADWLATTQRWADLLAARPWQGLIPLSRARVLQLSGDLVGALAVARAALPVLDRHGGTASRMQGYRRAGELALAMGDQAAAQAYLSQALALAAASRFPYEAALCHLALGGAVADAAAARTHVSAAHEVLSGLGAGPALQATAQALQRLEAGPTQRKGDLLTDREREVIRQVALGSTDKEIGAQLFISHRTVDRHLRNIFVKLDLPNRSSLAAYAARHGLLD